MLRRLTELREKYNPDNSKTGTKNDKGGGIKETEAGKKNDE